MILHLPYHYVQAIKRSVQDILNRYEQESYAAYEQVTGRPIKRRPDGKLDEGSNDALDAFRHAYTSAAMTQDHGALIALIAGHANEIKGALNGQDSKARNMDNWNNAVGRDIGEVAGSRAEIGELVYEALNNGELITDPFDPSDAREYEYVPLPDISDCIPDISGWINDLWNRFKNWFPPRRDPLAIDMDGDGIETTGADGTVLFDHNGDGVKTGTGWVSADDGFIVLDRNGNGTIDTGAELFGVDTVKADGSLAADGFDALSDLDSNGDAVFDAKDTEFANVKIWQDLDQDGISDPGELTSLTEAGIVSIDLDAESGNVNLGNGNVQSAAAVHLTVDGTEGTTANLDLAHSPFYREFTDSIALTEEATGLPESPGSGRVRDLREAMSLSSSLAAIVSNYAEQTTWTGQRGLLDSLVEAWAGTSTLQTSIETAAANDFKLFYTIPGQEPSDFNPVSITKSTSGGGGEDTASVAVDTAEKRALMARQEKITGMIAVLERFNGEPFVTVEAGEDEEDEDSVVTGAGQRIFVTASSSSGSDTSSSGGGTGNTNAPKRAFVPLSEQQINLLTQSYAQLKESVYGNLVIQTRLVDYTDEISLTLSDAGEIGFDFSDMNDLLETRRGTDSVNAFADLIELVRYQGTTLYNSGWEGTTLLKTWIDEADDANDAEDEAAITALLEEFNVTSTNGNLNGSNADEIIVDGDNGSRIYGMDGNDIIDAGAGNDSIWGGNGNDTLYGGAGRDSLFGGNGDDTLNGGDGRDNLYGSNGDDTLRGGAGSGDFLNGGSGNDTYLFGAGDGNTTVSNHDTGADRHDVLRFLEGIAASDVTASRSWSRHRP